MKNYLVLLIIGFITTKAHNANHKYASITFSEGSLENLGMVEYRKNPAHVNPEASFFDTFFSKESQISSSRKKPLKSINVPEQFNNRLPEVNLKYINSAEMINNDSVEDFVDISEEENKSAPMKDYKIKKLEDQEEIYANVLPIPKYAREFEENFADPNIVRKKRMANANYEGRYNYQNLDDVLKTISIYNPQTKKQVNKPKSRFKRSSNIIEEESVVTTISVSKFTGRATFLKQDLVFKNINI